MSKETWHSMEALKKMLSPTIRVLRGGKEEDVPSKNLVPGDIMLLEAGDKVSADARLVEIHSLRCDEAPLTGESVPVGKNIKPFSEDVRVSDRKNMAFTGTTVTYGRGKAVVTSTGMNTVGTFALRSPDFIDFFKRTFWANFFRIHATKYINSGG